MVLHNVRVATRYGQPWLMSKGDPSVGHVQLGYGRPSGMSVSVAAGRSEFRIRCTDIKLKGQGYTEITRGHATVGIAVMWVSRGGAFTQTTLRGYRRTTVRTAGGDGKSGSRR